MLSRSAYPRIGAIPLAAIHPNPLRGEQLQARIVSPSTGRAKPDIIDVRGRLVTCHDVGSLGAGRHSVDLAAGRRLPAGIYLVRLS